MSQPSLPSLHDAAAAAASSPKKRARGSRRKRRAAAAAAAVAGTGGSSSSSWSFLSFGSPFGSAAAQKAPRKVEALSEASAAAHPLNRVCTSKYTWWNALPKNLLEQFRRSANVYFLLISVLQVSTELSPTHRYATLLPLVAVLLVTLAKEVFEDWARHRADAEVNGRVARVLKHGAGGGFAPGFAAARWAEVAVGDVIEVRDGEQVPADMVLVATALEGGACYVETSNLDGETNLKLRRATDETRAAFDGAAAGGEDARAAAARAAQIHLVCGEPCDDLYRMEGTVACVGGGGGGRMAARPPAPVGVANAVWRGCRVTNTPWAVGVVVYTGAESKVILNTRAAPAKRSNVERLVDRAILLIFGTLALLCSMSTFLHSRWLDTAGAEGAWYLPFLRTDDEWETAAAFVTHLILFNNLVPISLYVSLEVVKLVQARLIEADAGMRHAGGGGGGGGGGASCRTSNLNEDLGQIQYVFTDKTGTLTENAMQFKRCSVGGVAYGGIPDLDRRMAGEDGDDDEVVRERAFQRAVSVLSTAPGRQRVLSEVYASRRKLMEAARRDDARRTRRQGTPHPSKLRRDAEEAEKAKGAARGAEYGFDDEQFLAELDAGGPQAARLAEFARAMALCHTAVPAGAAAAGDSDGAPAPSYRASSPDEAALVHAAARLGFVFEGRDDSDAARSAVFVRERGERRRYEVLAVNAFTSERKRMSVVLRAPDGQVFVYCKGADEVMLPLLRRRGEEQTVAAVHHLYEFGSEGLRTLVVGRAVLRPEQYGPWRERLDEAARADEGARDTLMADLAAEVERDLALVGATAVEDRLQEGVPETIESLKKAGVKVWMLTGDKLETAQNAGYASRLLDETMEIVEIDEDDPELTAIHLARAVKKYKEYLGGTHERLALVVSGSSLAHVLASAQNERFFLEIIGMARVVLACRVIPSQKARVVELVRGSVRPEPMTLAVGDGANDVAMIQAAHVGVGISGNEGMQAVRSSDYSFGQFRFLRRLLLVHGRWNYRRVSVVILYSFYKNITNVMTLFYYGVTNGFSGTTLYESWLGAGWNVGWTLLPVLFFGVFEQDIGARTALANPHAYQHGQRRREFSVGILARWVANAFLHSVVVFGIAYGALEGGGSVAPDGQPTGLYLMGTVVNACTVVAVTYKIMLETRHWVVWTFLGVAASAGLWAGFVSVYSRLADVSGQFFGVGAQLWSMPQFYLLLVLVPFAAVVPDIALALTRHMWWPTPLRLVQELEREARLEAAPGEEPDVAFEKRFLAAARARRRERRMAARGDTFGGGGREMTVSSAGARSRVATRVASLMSSLGLDTRTLAKRVRTRGDPSGGGGGVAGRRNKSLRSSLRGSASGSRTIGSRNIDARGGGGDGGGGGGGEAEADAASLVRMRRRGTLPTAPMDADLWPEREDEARAVVDGEAGGADPLLGRMRHLRDVLAGSDAAVEDRAEAIAATQTGSLVDSVRISPLSLRFVDFPRLEREFQAQYVTKSVGFVRGAFTIIFFLLVCYTVLVLTTEPEKEVLRVTVTVLALFGVALLWTPVFKRAFFQLLVGVLVCAGVARTLLITDNGAIGMGVYAIVTFFVTRAHFFPALVVCVLDAAFYAAWTHATGLNSTEKLVEILFLQVLIIAFAAHVSYEVEVQFRRDFLLQEQHEIDRAQNDSIIDNILPRYITQQIKARAAAAQAAAEAAAARMLESGGVAPELVAAASRSQRRLMSEGLRQRRSAEAGGEDAERRAPTERQDAAAAPPLAPADAVSSATSVGGGAGGGGGGDGGAGGPPSADPSAALSDDPASSSALMAATTRMPSFARPVSRVRTSFVAGLVGSSGRTEPIANDEGTVSILFADILNFDDMVATHSPERLVAILDAVYSLFDELCRKAGVQKMETVGKTYMACAGLEGTRRDHELATAELGTEMVALLGTVPDAQGDPLTIRVGIHTGEVISGVVGRTRPQFSLFGDAVNTASRMTSSSLPGRVHVSAATAEGLRRDYQLAEHTVELKGKEGRLKAFWLGDRLSKVSTKRRYDIVEKKKNLAFVVEEARQILEEHHDLRGFDPYDKSGIRLSPFLRFTQDGTAKARAALQAAAKDGDGDSGSDGVVDGDGDAVDADDDFDGSDSDSSDGSSDDSDEDDGNDEHARIIGEAGEQFRTETAKRAEWRFQAIRRLEAPGNARGPLAASALYFAFETAFDFVRGDSENSGDVTLAVVAVRYGAAALVAMALWFTYARAFSRLSKPVMTSTFAVTCAAAMAPPLVADDVVDTRVTLGLIFQVTLLSNSGVVGFLTTLVFNTVVCAVFLLTTALAADGSDTGELTFFVCAAAVVNCITSYGREVYLRRDYMLGSQVQQEKERAQSLLYQMVPREVAESLKEGQPGVSMEYGGVTILYSDIKGFTKFSASRPASEVVSLLSRLFTAFDALIVRRTVWKVQTIGDAYVVIGGFPFVGDRELSADEHADNVVRTGMDMIKAVNLARTEGGGGITMRIGIHTGRVIAGCIGLKSIRYDIWGSSALIANKMEAEGIPGGIVVSETSRWHLEHQYELKPHRVVRVKGAQFGRDLEIPSFAVVRRRVELEDDGSPVRLETVGGGDDGGGAGGSKGRVVEELDDGGDEEKIRQARITAGARIRRALRGKLAGRGRFKKRRRKKRPPPAV